MMNGALAAFERDLEEQGIQVVWHEGRRETAADRCRVCVLGVLLTREGEAIERYMLSRLTRAYRVVCIRQTAPGALFEYPALRYAQLYSIGHGEPVLYLHTKGAANPRPMQRKNINMWMAEFVGAKQKYEAKIPEYDLLMPYSGPRNITWQNGFIATPEAFSSIPPIEKSENRFEYEILFRDSSLSSFGGRLDSIIRNDDTDNTALMFDDIEKFSSFIPDAFWLRVLHWINPIK